nr:hypothetical protein [Tanacetum cinerariifolium]
TKPKAAKATKPVGDKAPKLTSTQPPNPKPTPTQPSKVILEKKQKLVKETPDEPSSAKRSKGGLVGKIRKPKSPLKLVDEPSAEDVSVKEPSYNEERDSKRIQPLLDVQGRGKEKTLTLMPTEASGHVESPSLDAKLALTDSEIESDNIVSKSILKIKMKARLDQTLQMDKEFTTTAYPNVQENLKLPSEDLVILKEPTSSTRTLSSLQNLEKELSFTDQFFVEKQHEKEPGKSNTKAEVQSMVSVSIHQDTSSVPPMTTSRIGELEQHVVDLLQSNLALEERLDKHGSWLYKLENLNIPHQVSKAIDEIVIDAVDWAMQASLRARFSDLPAVDMKEILQQRMFEDKSYEAHKDHKNLYNALQKTPFGSPSSQPPPPPPPAGTSGALGTSGASGSSQFPLPPPPSTSTSRSAQQQGSKAPISSKSVASAPQSMAWTTSDTRYESTGVFETQELSPIDSLIQDDSIPDEHVHLSNDEDSKNDHLPKAYSRKDWWKPLPEDERPATPEHAWTIPSFNVSDVEHNWATVLVSAYETPAENILLVKTGDMTNFLNWYCQQVNKTELTQADLEGQAYEVVEAFYPDVIHLQFQMEECHKMLTSQVDWTNPEGDQVRVDVNRPLPLGGPPGHVTIQTQFFFNETWST